MATRVPDDLRRSIGELGEVGRYAPAGALPVRPSAGARRLRRARWCRSWYAQYGESGPWLAFAPIFQIVTTQLLKASCRTWRSTSASSRWTARQRPLRPAARAGAYTFDHYYRRLRRRPRRASRSTALAVVGISATDDDRVAPGRRAARSGLAPRHRRRLRRARLRQRAGGEARRDELRANDAATGRPTSTTSSASCFSEPHSTKPYEDGVRYGASRTARSSRWAGGLVRQRPARARQARSLPDAGDPRRRGRPRAARQRPGDRRAGSRREAAHDRRRRPSDDWRATRSPSAARCAISSAVGRPRDLGARRWRASAAPCSSRARSASATCSATWPSRARCASSSPIWRSTGSPSTPLRPTSNAKASGCIRSRSAWPTRAGTSRRGRRARPAGLLRAAHDGRGDGAATS